MRFTIATLVMAIAAPLATAELIDRDYWLRSIAPEVRGNIEAFRSKRTTILSDDQHLVLARAINITMGEGGETADDITPACEDAFGPVGCAAALRGDDGFAEAQGGSRKKMMKRNNSCCNTESVRDAELQCNIAHGFWKTPTCTQTDDSNACYNLQACGLLKQDMCNAVCGCTGIFC